MRLDGGEGDDDIYATPEDHAFRDENDTDDSDDETAGRLFGLSNRLTVSFAPDGTSIFDQSNRLFSAFAFSPSQLQNAVLEAFETWAINGNLDVGLVADSGLPFGTPGKSFGDERFGDVRVGAISLPADVNAIAIGQDDFVAGTWAGDILFNSNAQFKDANQFFAVALHEIGHVLGLGHTDNINSAMHRYSNRATLHAQDISDFQFLYGIRSLDEHDDETANNDTLANATRLRFEGAALGEGSYPTIAFGDIAHLNDVDFFEVRIPDNYSGPVSFEVISQSISQLDIKAALLSRAGVVLESQTSQSPHGSIVSFTRNANPGDRYFVKVESASAGSFGSFSVTANLDSRSTVTRNDLLAVAQDREFANFDSEEFADYFADPLNFLINEDQHTDDSENEAVELSTEDGFELYSRYQHRASLADASDIDFYRFKAVDNAAQAMALNVSVRALEFQGMVPKIKLRDSAGNELVTETVVNGHGEYAIQLPNFASSAEYLISVESDSLLGFRHGNYELVISHSRDPMVFRSLATGQLDSNSKRYHSLHVAKSQMFQFGLEAAASGTAKPLIWGSIYDETGKVVQQIATRAGERRTAATVLLKPGSYTVEIEQGVGAAFGNLTYQLTGIDVGDPQGPEFTDPTDSPFDQNNDGTYKYPDDVVSIDTFVVVDGISSNQNNPPNDSPPTNLFKWYWGI